MQYFRVCVSNLPKDTNEDKLTKVFCDLDFIKITLEKTFKGESKGFAFIEFGNEMEMNKALEMNGHVVDGKKLRISREKEDLCEFGYVKKMKKRKGQEKDEIKEKEIEKEKEKEKDQKIDVNDEMNKNKDWIHQKLEELSKKMNQIIFSNSDDPSKVIPVELSSNNPQLICELKHLFGDMDEKEFKQQIARNDELKRIYLNCCSTEQVSTEHKLCKIQHLRFDENPLKDEQLKELCCVLVKGFEGTKIDFNICNLMTSNKTSLNIVPEQAIVFELTFDNKILGDHTFKELVTDKRKQKVIEMNLQKKISEVLEIPFGEIVFVKIREGSVKFDGILPSKVLSRHTQSDVDLHEFIYKDMKQLFTEGLENFYPLKEVEVALQTFKTKLCLNPNDFDARGDYYFKTKKGEKLVRGGMVYYQPSQKWKRFGLRVLGIYENDDWIKMDGNPNEWIVAYHGTRNTGERGLECMRKSRGSFDAYAGQTPTNRNDKIPQLGIYFAQNVEDCYKTIPVELNGQKYEVAFQCRIHPDHVWITGNRSFIVVDNPNYVRPYGILLKKMSSKKK